MAKVTALSQREQQIVDLAAAGFLDKEIHRQLNISDNTLKTYWKRIRAKLGDQPRAGIVAEYVRESMATSRTLDHDWEVDLITETYLRVSDRPVGFGLTLPDKLPLDDAISYFHPIDADKVRQMVRDVAASDLPAFFFRARLVTPEGLRYTSVFVQVERDESGKAIRLYGSRTQMFDNADSNGINEPCGWWEYDPATKQFRGDDLAEKFAKWHLDPAQIEIARNQMHELMQQAVQSQCVRIRHNLLVKDTPSYWIAVVGNLEYKDGELVSARGIAHALN